MKTYRFANPVDSDEAKLEFQVIQERDTRVLVYELTQFKDWRFPPVFVYQKSELVEIKDRQQIMSHTV